MVKKKLPLTTDYKRDIVGQSIARDHLMAEKLTYVYVKQQFEEAGCKLLESAYVNAHVKMKYQCVCGTLAEINWNNFKSGKRCMVCRGNATGDARRHSADYVKTYFAEQKCELLSEYVAMDKKVKYRCFCGNVDYITFSHFKSGQRCRNCKRKKTADKLSLSYEEVKEYFEEQGCELISKSYKNARTKLDYRCSCGRLAKIVFDSFKRGNRCKHCGIEKNSGPNSACWIEDRNLVKANKTFRKRCYEMLHRTLMAIGEHKTSRTHVMLGYSPKELKCHITSHPNWHYVKDEDWHIDHIIPIKAFLDHGIRDLKVINALENLQPLSQYQNNSKSYKYDKQDLIEYLEGRV